LAGIDLKEQKDSKVKTEHEELVCEMLRECLRRERWSSCWTGRGGTVEQCLIVVHCFLWSRIRL